MGLESLVCRAGADSRLARTGLLFGRAFGQMLGAPFRRKDPGYALLGPQLDPAPGLKEDA